MRRLLFCGVLAIGFGTSPALEAGITASATITATADGSNWDYAITLTNSGTSTAPIGTFWFAWVPGEDFMPDSPTNVQAPTGWDVNAITHGTAPDGYAIRWEASPVANALAPEARSLDSRSLARTRRPRSWVSRRRIRLPY